MPGEDTQKLLFENFLDRFQIFARMHHLPVGDQLRLMYAVIATLGEEARAAGLGAEELMHLRAEAVALSGAAVSPFEEAAPPVADEPPAADEPPSADEAVPVEESQSTEEAPSTEEAESAEESPSTEEAPSAEESPSSEESPSAEESPSSEEPPSTDETSSAAEVSSAAEAPSVEAATPDEASTSATEPPSVEPQQPLAAEAPPPTAERSPAAEELIDVDVDVDVDVELDLGLDLELEINKDSGEGETVITVDLDIDEEAEWESLSELFDPEADLLDEATFDPEEVGLKPIPALEEQPSVQEAFGGLRQHQRFVAKRTALVVVDGSDTPMELETEDISAGGMFLQTGNPPDKGALLSVTLDAPGGPLELRGKVARVLDREAATRENKTAGAGVQFLDLTDERRRALEALLGGFAEQEERPPLEIDIDLEEDDVERALRFLQAADAAKFYESLELPPEANETEVYARVEELAARFSNHEAASSDQELTLLKTATSVLARVSTMMMERDRRLVYDFTQGHVRADERLAEYIAEGRDPDELRGAWCRVYPDRVQESLALIEEAAAQGKQAKYDQAIKAAQRAVELDPFQPELRAALERLQVYDGVTRDSRAGEIDAPGWLARGEAVGIGAKELRTIWCAEQPGRIDEAKQLRERARDLRMNGKVGEALALIRDVLRHDPFNAGLREAVMKKKPSAAG